MSHVDLGPTHSRMSRIVPGGSNTGAEVQGQERAQCVPGRAAYAAAE